MSINTHSTQVSPLSLPPNFIPYGVVVPNQPGPTPGHVGIAQTLLNLDPQNSEPPHPDALQSRSFTQIASTLPQEAEMNQLSQEEQDQIWVMKPKVTIDTQRNVKKVVVKKNSKEWVRGTYVDDVIVKSTPKDYIADGENTEFYDEEGNFICGIVYDVNVEMGAMKKLAPLANSSAQRGAAGGLIVDIEAAKEKLKSDGYHDIDVVGDGWALRYRKNEGKGQYSTFANRHYSTTYGVTGSAKSYIVDTVAPTKASGLQTLQPYFRLLTQCFLNQFPAQTLSHLQRMKECEGHYFFQPGTCFSSLVVNCHEINEKGEETKNSRAAIHRDEKHHPDAYEVMLTLKENIEGGDLYLPEYGILIKLKDRSVTCFNATLLKHTVTKIGRENVLKSACRVTAVAHMNGFSGNALVKAKEKVRERTLAAISAAMQQQAAGLVPQGVAANNPHPSQFMRQIPNTPIQSPPQSTITAPASPQQQAAGVVPQGVAANNPHPSQFMRQIPNTTIQVQPQSTATAPDLGGLYKVIAESQALIKQLKDENQVLSLQKQVAESRLETANLKITVLTEKLQRAEAALTGQGNHQTPATFSTTTDTGSSPERFKRILSDLELEEASLVEPSSKRPRIEKY